MHGPRCKKSFALRRVVTLTEPVHTPSPTPYPHLRPWSLLTRLLLFPETFSPLLPLYWLFIKRVYTQYVAYPLALPAHKTSLLVTLLAFYYAPRFRACAAPPAAQAPRPQAPQGRTHTCHRSHIHMCMLCTCHIHMCMCTCHIHMCMCTCHIHIHNDQCHDSDSHLHIRPILPLLLHLHLDLPTNQGCGTGSQP